MTLEERVASLEERMGKQDPIVKQLREWFDVTTALEVRQSRLLKDHAEWLASHDQAMLAHAAEMKEHDARMKDLDARIAGLVSGFGEWISRSRPA